MSNNRLFLMAGWCALGAAISMLLATLSLMIAPSAVGIFELLFLLLLIIVFYALYVAHRPESSWLSLAGLFLLLVAIGVDFVSMQNQGKAVLVDLWYVALSLPFLIFGFLGWRSPRMPRGAAGLALLAGVTYLFAGLVGVSGNQPYAQNASSISILFVLAWLVWLWRVFRSGMLTAA